VRKMRASGGSRDRPSDARGGGNGHIWCVIEGSEDDLPVF